MENPMALVHNGNHAEKKVPFSDNLGLRSPVFQNTKWQKVLPLFVERVRSHSREWPPVPFTVLSLGAILVPRGMKPQRNS